MRVLSSNRWKYALPFDNVLYREVKRFSLRLNTLERECMECEIEHYRKHFSIEQIMKAFRFLRTPQEKESFIKAVLKRDDHILFIPLCLAEHYKSVIKKEFAEYESFFSLMLEKGLNQKGSNELKKMYKVLLGNYYKGVIKNINRFGKQVEVLARGRKLKSEEYEVKARASSEKNRMNVDMAEMFGRCTIRKNFAISVVDEFGLGEWTSKEVSFASDRYFLATNKNGLTEEDVDNRVLLNVYPGKAYFYDRVLSPKENISFDNGAGILINGWSMYAMTHSKSRFSAYAMLGELSRVSKCMLSKNLAKSTEQLYLYIIDKYPKSMAINKIIEYTQKPYKPMSYAMGAFAIEGILGTTFASSPDEFLETLSYINCGDYLGIYHPKVQKKLSKNSITARVSKKFS